MQAWTNTLVQFKGTLFGWGRKCGLIAGVHGTRSNFKHHEIEVESANLHPLQSKE